MTETAADLPVSYWRGLLDSRWQAEVRRVTELSLEFCDAAEHVRKFASPGPAGPDAGEVKLATGLLRRAESRAVAARRSLADIENAMARLSTGRFGRCEQCGTDMPARWLTRLPEARYCPAAGPACGASPARVPPRNHLPQSGKRMRSRSRGTRGRPARSRSGSRDARMGT